MTPPLLWQRIPLWLLEKMLCGKEILWGLEHVEMSFFQHDWLILSSRIETFPPRTYCSVSSLSVSFLAPLGAPRIFLSLPPALRVLYWGVFIHPWCCVHWWTPRRSSELCGSALGFSLFFLERVWFECWGSAMGFWFIFFKPILLFFPYLCPAPSLL